jgi:hypothetical protein
MIEAVKKALGENEIAMQDKQRLMSAERVGPGWASRCCQK